MTSRSDRSPKHIVDILIEERAPRLAASPLWPLLQPLLRAMLNYREARRMADAIAPLGGYAALDHVSDLLRLSVSTDGLDHVPRQGRCILMMNHPTGIADGIAVYDAVRPVRPDICFFANADAHRVCPGFSESLIPVDWPAETRTLKSAKRTLKRARQALDAERLIGVFPAGAIARVKNGRLEDPPWEHSAAALARKHAAPVVPVHVAGPFSRLFHLFDKVSEELRDITLFHELLNKKRGDYRLIFGAPIPPAALAGDAADVTARVKAYVERSLTDADAPPFPG
nr:1-acyl-sn-glycerol-3-phosphate acyltransferase [Marinicauda salina]